MSKMHRKPFRIPFLKAIKRDLDNEDSDQQDPNVELPPVKKLKQKIDTGEVVAAEEETFSAIKYTPLGQTAPRRLLNLKNSTFKRPVIKLSEQPDDSGSSSENYYNVLWRKFTTKKHKTFDGDGVLVVMGGYATLQDLNGKDLGKTICHKALQPGDQLSLGSKEIEVDSVLSKEDYMAGRPFLKNEVSAPGGSRDFTQSICAPIIPSFLNKQFKSPLTSNLHQKPISSKTPTPRHDPDAPNALVMPQPTIISISKGKCLVDIVVDPFLCQNLRPHQRDGVKFLYEAVMGFKSQGCQGAILADEMGLGKTLQTIALLWTLMKQNPLVDTGNTGVLGVKPVVKKALVVCPVTLINNWRKEFRKWLGNERIGVLVAGEKTNIKDFTAGKIYNVMIVGYERLQKIQNELKKAEIDIVIADEGHRLKSEKNKAAQAIRNLKTKRRVILSGTPLQNDLHEFFVMVDFVNPGLLDTYASFRRNFEGPIVKSQQPEASQKDIDIGRARAGELASITKMFILRRTAEILSNYLPPKTEYVVFCRPTEQQLDVYKEILNAPTFDSCLRNPQSSLQLITLLKKICNSPALLGKKDKKEGQAKDNLEFESLFSLSKTNLRRNVSISASGKLRTLEQILVTLWETTNEKIVLVSNYTSTLDLLQNLLNSRGYSFLRLDGSTAAAKRQDLVDRFNHTDSKIAFAFLLSAKSGGAGINLIGASRLVLVDLDWNPATDHQAMARIHRDGQRKEVKIYRMITTGSIDEKIYQRQLSKQGLANSVMDQKMSAPSFSLAELRDLFTLDEETECQTHDLLGCMCMGKGGAGGVRCRSGSRERDGINETGEEKDKNTCIKAEDGSEGEADSVPIDLFPGLIKASQMQMEKIEEEFRRTRPNMQKAKKEQLSMLMNYEHYVASALIHPRNDTSPGKIVVESNGDEPDAEKQDDNDMDKEIRHIGGGDDGDDYPLFIADEVLTSVIQQGAGIVSYVFQKFD